MSAPMQLLWSPRSPFVRKVTVCAHELGLMPFITLIPSVVMMTQANEDVLALNPIGKIPSLLLADGRVIPDSLLIIDYLDSLTGGHQLIPQDPEARLNVLAHHALANGLIDILVLWRNERDKPAEQQSQEWITHFERKTWQLLDHLGKNLPTLNPDQPTLAEITYAIVLGYLDFRFPQLDWRSRKPELLPFADAMAQRPSFQATLPAA